MFLSNKDAGIDTRQPGHSSVASHTAEAKFPEPSVYPSTR
jgi:hypothetical protein